MSDAGEINLRPEREDDWDLLRHPPSPDEMLARVSKMISDHQRMEEQLRQSQKMEAVGRLAGGVAHDFNNLLTVIAGYSSLLKEELSPDGEQPELDEIQGAVKRAADLTRQLLAFSRKQGWQPRVLDVNAVVAGMEGMLRRLIGENILFVTALAGDLGRIKADPGQVEQVIMNLVVNARDAMPHGGKLVLETKPARVDEGQIPALAAGRYVVLSVTDTGHGISSDTVSRIFEPFFTTKEVGRGTGLGLSTALGIAQQSGGTLTVESTPGAGSIFRAYLPLTSDQPEDEKNGRTSESPAARRATVLLVEDETALRKLVFQVLTAAGHRVMEAANGEEALALSARHRKPIDLLITDVIMPGITGPELVAKLRANRPRTMVLYMSGYDRELLDRNSLEASAGFLPKPFSPRALLARIDELLAAGEGGHDAVQFGR
jgi:signal transduction histidine kinase